MLALFKPWNHILLITFILLGVFTSILNHGFTNNLFKWSDRLVMFFGFFTDSYIILNLESNDHPHFNLNLYSKKVLCFSLMGFAALSYIVAKQIINLLKQSKTAVKQSKQKKSSKFIELLLSNTPHMCAHVLLTATHCLLIIFVSET